MHHVVGAELHQTVHLALRQGQIELALRVTEAAVLIAIQVDFRQVVIGSLAQKISQRGLDVAAERTQKICDHVTPLLLQES